MEDLLELSSDAMKYVVIEERLMDPLRKKWKDAKRTKLEYYIANINPSESYDEILRGGEDLYVYVCLIHTSRLGALKDEYPLTFVLRSYGSILASLWTLKISIYPLLIFMF